MHLYSAHVLIHVFTQVTIIGLFLPKIILGLVKLIKHIHFLCMYVYMYMYLVAPDPKPKNNL